MIRIGRFLAELRRRHVFRVTALYAAVAFVIAQVADIAFPALRLPEWALTLVIVLLLLGFPVAIVLAWAFDLTTDGLVRAESPDRPDADTMRRPGGRRSRWIAAGAGVVAISLVFGMRLFADRSSTPPGTPASEWERSIAVLPFANLSADAEQEYFSDGLTEELLNAISKIPGIHVAARTSSFAFKGQRVPVDSIGRALRVAHVVEGTVRRSGDRIRITAQLTDAASGYQLWSQTFERRFAEIFEIQDQISFAIAEALRMRIPGGEGGATRMQTTDPGTYDLYLRGRFAVNARTRAALEEGLAHFQEAHHRDRTFAPALAGLADTYLLLTEYGWAPPAEALPRAVEAAQRALTLDEGLAESHISSGYALYWTRDLPGAERAFRRAIELNPSAAAAHQWYAELLLTLGRVDESVSSILTAQRLDPLSDRIRVLSAFILMRARLHDDALSVLARETDTQPFIHFVYSIRALCYTAMGMHARALTEMERARDVDPELWQLWRLPDHAYILVQMDRVNEARQLLDRFRTESHATAGFGTGMARLYAALRDEDRTLEWLERTLAEQPTALLHQSVALQTNIVFDFLRGQPRFQTVLAELGLR